MDNSSTSGIYSELPNSYLNSLDVNTVTATLYVQRFLTKSVPSKELPKNLTGSQSYFKLSKSKWKQKHPARKKKTYISRQEKAELGLLKCPNSGWNYVDLLNLHSLWKSYIINYMSLGNSPPPKPGDKSWPSFSLLLGKADFHGAELLIERSKCPTHVGLLGICILDTKNTFVLVCKDNKKRTIPKETSVFQITVNNLQLTLFGKYLMTRPNERSVKKIKLQMFPDL